MPLLVWMLLVPLVTAALGGLSVPRQIKEAIMVGGLSLTFGLGLATAGQFLNGTVPSALTSRNAPHRRTDSAIARASGPRHRSRSAGCSA